MKHTNSLKQPRKIFSIEKVARNNPYDDETVEVLVAPRPAENVYSLSAQHNTVAVMPAVPDNKI